MALIRIRILKRTQSLNQKKQIGYLPKEKQRHGIKKEQEVKTHKEHPHPFCDLYIGFHFQGSNFSSFFFSGEPCLFFVIAWIREIMALSKSDFMASLRCTSEAVTVSIQKNSVKKELYDQGDKQLRCLLLWNEIFITSKF